MSRDPIALMEDDELTNIILTTDGYGKETKRDALNELLDRARQDGYGDGFADGFDEGLNGD